MQDLSYSTCVLFALAYDSEYVYIIEACPLGTLGDIRVIGCLFYIIWDIDG